MAYSVSYVLASVVEELRGSHNLGIFVHIATDPALHIWFGVHDIPASIDAVDPDGTVYLGGGRLIGIPSLEVLVNGTADSVEFTLSGIDPETGGRLYQSIPPVRGCDLYVGITTLDQYYQPMSNIIPIWKGTASHTTRASESDGTSKRTMTLALTVSSGEPGRSRPSRAVWSHAQHTARYPGDNFCKNTARMARGNQPVWPYYAND